MTLATRWPSRLFLVACLATLLVAPGCQENDGANVTPEDFKAKTTGAPDELAQHLTRLNQTYAGAAPRTPAASRDLRLAFSSAVIKTTDALMADPKTSPAMREAALQFQFEAYSKRKDIDPKAEQELLAAAARIEANNPGSEIATRAAEKVAQVLGEQAQYGPESERHQRYAVASKAVIHAASREPQPTNGAEILLSLANDCEAKRFFDLAREVHTALSKYYPKSAGAKFAVGAIHRHDLKGKPIEDLVGPGDDGKPLSIKDFRGKIVLVCFWVSSLPLSLEELKNVEDFRKKYDPKDFVVLGIALDPDKEKGKKILKEMKIDWPQIYSKVTSQEIESEQNLRYGVKSLVYKMVVDREGNLADYGHMLFQVQPTLETLLPKPVENGEKKPDTPPPTETPKAK